MVRARLIGISTTLTPLLVYQLIDPESLSDPDSRCEEHIAQGRGPATNQSDRDLLQFTMKSWLARKHEKRRIGYRSCGSCGE